MIVNECPRFIIYNFAGQNTVYNMRIALVAIPRAFYVIRIAAIKIAAICNNEMFSMKGVNCCRWGTPRIISTLSLELPRIFSYSRTFEALSRQRSPTESTFITAWNLYKNLFYLFYVDKNPSLYILCIVYAHNIMFLVEDWWSYLSLQNKSHPVLNMKKKRVEDSSCLLVTMEKLQRTTLYSSCIDFWQCQK